MHGVFSWVVVVALLVPRLCALAPLPNGRTSSELSWRLASRARGGAVKAARDVDEDDGRPHRSSSSSRSTGARIAASTAAVTDDSGGPPDQVVVRMAPAGKKFMNGVYSKTDWDLNGRAHYERSLAKEDKDNGALPDEKKIHLYWSSASHQWVMHYELDPALDYEKYLGYAKVDCSSPLRTDRHWLVRENHRWSPVPNLRVSLPGAEGKESGVTDRTAAVEDRFRTPTRLVPILVAFFLDSVGTGLASPLLPFYIMSLGANAFQLGVVLAFNYLAQTVGCIVMGHVSDRYGRKNVIIGCLVGSIVSISVVSRATTLSQVAFGRVLGGMFGGFVPVAQSAVADLCPVEYRPKFLGRIQACTGLGFVAGPTIYVIANKWFGFTTQQVLQRAAILPAMALVYALIFVKETKDFMGSRRAAVTSSWALPPAPIRLLVANGFLLMWAFSTETVYAMFIKDNFGYGETALGTVFALNGVAVGVLQILLIKNLFATLGKHVMLVVGNLLLAGGMIGLSLIRHQLWHFFMFFVHIMGYAISDTALASLISRYSSPDAQGKNLGWSHAAQSCARIISPLVAGILYERSKEADHPLPLGALPYIAGSLMPLLGMTVPTVLYLRSVEGKRRKEEEAQAAAAAAR